MIGVCAVKGCRHLSVMVAKVLSKPKDLLDPEVVQSVQEEDIIGLLADGQSVPLCSNHHFKVVKMALAVVA